MVSNRRDSRVSLDTPSHVRESGDLGALYCNFYITTYHSARYPIAQTIMSHSHKLGTSHCRKITGISDQDRPTIRNIPSNAVTIDPKGVKRYEWLQRPEELSWHHYLRRGG